VNAVEVSTTTRPVTHTALTEVKKESRYDKGSECALGSINSPDPIKMIIKKLVEKIMAGGMFIELKIKNKPDILEIPIRKIATTIGVFPMKNIHKDFSLFTK